MLSASFFSKREERENIVTLKICQFVMIFLDFYEKSIKKK